MSAMLVALCFLSIQKVLGDHHFTPVEWSPQASSSQCGVASNSDLTSAINTVAQMITNTIEYIPQSCLEVKIGSLESPSGYYTILDDTSGVPNIVYCDMDDLNNCPALEQTLTGLLSNYQTLTNQVSGLTNNYETLDSSVSGLEGDYASLSNSVSGLTSNVAGLTSNYGTLDTSLSGLENDYASLSNSVSGLTSNYDTLTSSVSEVQTDVSNLQVGFDTFQLGDATSCEDIKSKWPWATSGWYKISSEDVYCYMGDRCGVAGPWRRVLYLDMTDSSQTCPTGYRIYNTDGVRTCGRPVGDGSCVESLSPTSSLSYSKICGRVIGYQWGSPDGLHNGGINSIYVDGVSVTRGNPRQHVWTLINKYNEDQQQCPCSGGSDLPAFIGDDYFCESGLIGDWSPVLYTGDPIWDGQQCGSEEASCCSLPTVPWFYKDLGSSTTDYIELRTCGNQHTDDEDTTVAIYEIYVQ